MGLNKPLNLQYIKCLFLAGKLGGGVGLTGHDWALSIAVRCIS